MSWTIKLGEIGGSVIRVHLTFFLLLAVIAAISWPSGGIAAATNSVVFVALVFVCVLLHEYGHAAAARRYGIRTPDITLLPIGGLARLERMPEKPGQEIVVALAGPAVNIAIAAALLLYLLATGSSVDRAGIEAAAGSLPGRLLAANLFLVVFNMIPAFPLDGGRALRAIIAFRLPRDKATRIAARIGQGFAILFGVVGFFANPMLVLIAIFMFFAAEAESSHETTLARAGRHLARDAMISRTSVVSPETPVETALGIMRSGGVQRLMVLDAIGRPLGVVTHARLLDALHDEQGSVATAMQTGLPSVGLLAPLTEALIHAAQAPAQVVAVIDPAGEYRGHIVPDSAQMLIAEDEARERAGARAGRFILQGATRRDTAIWGLRP